MAFRELVVPSVPGRLYLHSLPGRLEPLSDVWAEVGERSVGQIVCLTPREEAARHSPEYARAMSDNSAPVPVRQVPIRDFGAHEDDAAFWNHATQVAESLRNGENALVHCYGGIGRTGLFATTVLLALGIPKDEAEQRVSEAGSRCEAPSQREALDRFARRAGEGPPR